MRGLPTINITVETDSWGVLSGVNGSILNEAFHRGALLAATIAKAVWMDIADRQGVKATGNYKNFIQAAEPVVKSATPDTGGDLPDRWEIIIELENKCPYAGIIEEGHAAFHLPSVVNWGSASVKRSKTGTPYLHIPFRHRAYAAPAARESKGLTGATLRAMMPQHIYREAKKLGLWHRQHAGPISAQGQFVAADRYVFTAQGPQGGRLEKRRLDRGHVQPMIQLGHHPGTAVGESPGTLNVGFEERRSARVVGRDREGNPLMNPAWTASKYHGMFRMGTKGHSGQFLTVRTMTPNSHGWNVPAMLGRWVIQRTATFLQANPQEMEQALTAGIAEVVSGGTGGAP